MKTWLARSGLRPLFSASDSPCLTTEADREIASGILAGPDMLASIAAVVAVEEKKRRSMVGVKVEVGLKTQKFDLSSMPLPPKLSKVSLVACYNSLVTRKMSSITQRVSFSRFEYENGKASRRLTPPVLLH